MICPKCGQHQIGGSICSKCGTKLNKTQETLSSAGNMQNQPSPQTSVFVKKKSSFSFFKKKQSLVPPPPEHVRRKLDEKKKFKLKGFGLFFFQIYNLLTRTIESILFCAIFHSFIWLMAEIADFFGGLVSPENEISFEIMMIYKWEYIVFGIITLFTFRKRWGS